MWKLGPDQGVERHRDLLGGEEAAAQEHRAAHVDEQHRRRPGQLLGPEYLEIGGRQVHATAGPKPGAGCVLGTPQRVFDRPPDVEVERVAELVWLGRLLALPTPTSRVDPVTAECIA